MLQASAAFRSRAERRRRGAATLYMMGLLVLLSGLMLSVLEIYCVETAQVEMRNSADAAAGACVGRFVDDRLLTGDPQVLTARMAAARDQAHIYGLLNCVFGDGVELDVAESDHSDVALGRVDTTTSLQFVGGSYQASDPVQALLLLNAVHIHAHRTRIQSSGVCIPMARRLGVPSANVAAQATAMLDRDVIGFQPYGSRPIPLVPIALLSDPLGSDSGSWEAQVEKGMGRDDFTFDQETKQTQSAPDGLHELALTFRDNAPIQANIRVLQLGVAQWSDMLEQVRRGVAPTEMGNLPGGQLVLGASGTVLEPVFTYPSSDADPDAQALLTRLQALQQTGEARIWPLFQRPDDAATGDAVLSGFVAARVVRAEQDAGGFEVVVQPCMMTAPAAVTDASRRSADRPAGNPYLCKIRILP